MPVYVYVNWHRHHGRIAVPAQRMMATDRQAARAIRPNAFRLCWSKVLATQIACVALTGCGHFLHVAERNGKRSLVGLKLRQVIDIDRDFVS